jgi:putative urate catabolism protein
MAYIPREKKCKIDPSFSKGSRMTGAPGDTRNYKGYGENPPHADWPGGARIAVQFVLNYEEGGENCVLNGDAGAETFLSEIINAPRVPDRHMSMESLYEYGSRAGVWRVLRLFKKHDIRATVFAVAMALEKYPEMAQAFLKDGHEICSHGYRWIDYQNVDIETEREHMRKAIKVIAAATGQRPLGWYTGRTSPHTRKLVMEEGGFLYDADDYSDDLPFWHAEGGKAQLIVPYTLDTNDMRFASPQGFNSGDQYYAYLRDAFDTLYAEGDVAPKMLSIGLHCRIVGRPARTAALERFIRHVKSHEKVWICRRIDIARHWIERHPYQGGKT